MWWAVTNSACMGHHNWVNEEVNETRYRRWVERDTIDKTGTHQQWSPALTTHFAFELLFLETCPPYMFRVCVCRFPLTFFRVLISPKTHASENLNSIL